MKIYKRDKGKCWICGERRPVHMMTKDHLIPKSLGGTDALWNVALACRDCNQDRGTDPPTLEILLKNCVDGNQRALAMVMYNLLWGSEGR